MIRVLANLLVVCVAQVACCQVAIQGPVQAAPGNLVVLRAEVPEGAGHTWAVIPAEASAHFLPVTSDGKPCGVFATSTPGRYYFALAVAEGHTASLVIHTLTIGDVPPPTPPPGPDPPDPPTPDPGKRVLLLIHESSESTAAFARLVAGLRNGAPAEYLRSNGHALSILDDDSVGPDGRPSPVVESWRPHFADLTLPVVFVINSETGEELHKQAIAKDAKPDDVIEILRAHGGQDAD